MSDRKSGVCGVVSLLLAVLNGLGLVGFAVSLLLFRPTFAQMYADFGAVLPSATVALFSIPSSVVIVVSLLLLVALIGKEFTAHKSMLLVINCIWLVLAIAVSICVSMALMAPMNWPTPGHPA